MPCVESAAHDLNSQAICEAGGLQVIMVVQKRLPAMLGTQPLDAAHPLNCQSDTLCRLSEL